MKTTTYRKDEGGKEARSPAVVKAMPYEVHRPGGGGQEGPCSVYGGRAAECLYDEAPVCPRFEVCG